MRSLHLLLALSLALGAVAACDNEPDHRRPGPLTAQQAARAQARDACAEACHHMATCGEDGDSESGCRRDCFYEYPSSASCVSCVTSAACVDLFGDIGYGESPEPGYPDDCYDEYGECDGYGGFGYGYGGGGDYGYGGYGEEPDYVCQQECWYPTGCVADADCGLAGTYCGDDGCAWEPQCKKDADCGAENEICIEDLCWVPDCRKDSDCPALEECEGGFCADNGRCLEDADCEEETSCYDGYCEWGGYGYGGSGGGYGSGGYGGGYGSGGYGGSPEPECVDDEDCPEGWDCYDGWCY